MIRISYSSLHNQIEQFWNRFGTVSVGFWSRKLDKHHHFRSQAGAGLAYLELEIFPFPFTFDDATIFYIRKALIYCVSTITTILIISLALFISTQVSGYNEENLIKPVKRATCTCDCWDGFFRGVYSRGGYKTFCFNYELQFTFIVGLFLFFAELLRHFLVQLVFHKRYKLLMLLPAIYPNFYGPWVMMNYLNDHDYERMLPSQLFFSVTEVVTTYIVYQCLLINKKEVPVPAWGVYLVVIIASIHLLLAMGQMNVSFVFRNTGLLAADWINLIWGTVFLIRNPELRPNIFVAVTWIFIGCFILIIYFVACPFYE